MPGARESKSPPPLPPDGPAPRLTLRPPEPPSGHRPLEGCFAIGAFASIIGLLLGLLTIPDQPVVGVLTVGFSALVLLLGCLGLVLAQINEHLDLLSEDRRQARNAEWKAQWKKEQARQEEEARAQADYWRGVGHGAAQNLRALRVRRAHLAEIRRGRWQRRSVWVRSLPGRFDAALRRAVGEENRILAVFCYGLICLGSIAAAAAVVWAGFLR